MTKEDLEILDETISELRQSADDEGCNSNPELAATYKERVRVLSQIRIEQTLTADRQQPKLPIRLEYATDDVPWKREGYPGTVVTREYQEKWGRDVSNAGVCKERLYTDAQMIYDFSIYGVYERAFAYLWDYEQNGTHRGGILSTIMREEPVASLIRDEQDGWLCMLVAQSIIQWLGTNCGRSFMQTATETAERDKNRLEEEKRFLQKLTACPTGNNRD